MKILEFIGSLFLIGTLLYLCVPICVFGLWKTVIDKIKKK